MELNNNNIEKKTCKYKNEIVNQSYLFTAYVVSALINPYI